MVKIHQGEQREREFKYEQKVKNEIPKPPRRVYTMEAIKPHLKKNPRLARKFEQFKAERNDPQPDEEDNCIPQSVTVEEQKGFGVSITNAAMKVMALPMRFDKRSEFEANLKSNQVLREYVMRRGVMTALGYYVQAGDTIRFGANYAYEYFRTVGTGGGTIQPLQQQATQ